MTFWPGKNTGEEVGYLILKTQEKSLHYRVHLQLTTEDKKSLAKQPDSYNNLNAAVHYGLCKTFRLHFCWIDSVKRCINIKNKTGLKASNMMPYFTLSWKTSTNLRLSSAPPTTTMLLSALSFSLNSSMLSALHCRACCPITNNTGVFMSSSGSSTSCSPVTAHQ